MSYCQARAPHVWDYYAAEWRGYVNMWAHGRWGAYVPGRANNIAESHFRVRATMCLPTPAG
jgi:hypothetical protein